jgi:hypothetical protein
VHSTTVDSVGEVALAKPDAGVTAWPDVRLLASLRGAEGASAALLVARGCVAEASYGPPSSMGSLIIPSNTARSSWASSDG